MWYGRGSRTTLYKKLGTGYILRGYSFFVLGRSFFWKGKKGERRWGKRKKR